MFTLEQYTTLKAAIAQGSKIVQYADKRVEYRSLDEMLAILKMMEQELGIGSGSANFQGTRRVAQYDKGI
ncbi:MAG: phage head-tail joining protein [Saprospiraceae bacterium]